MRIRVSVRTLTPCSRAPTDLDWQAVAFGTTQLWSDRQWHHADYSAGEDSVSTTVHQAGSRRVSARRKSCWRSFEPFWPTLAPRGPGTGPSPARPRHRGRADLGDIVIHVASTPIANRRRACHRGSVVEPSQPPRPAGARTWPTSHSRAAPQQQRPATSTATYLAACHADNGRHMITRCVVSGHQHPIPVICNGACPSAEGWS